MEIEEVKKEIEKILKSELSEKLAGQRFSAFFFGSWVTGTNTSTSDIDVGIEAASTVPENTLRAIKSRCDAIPTLFSIDIVDFSTVSDDFKKVAKSKIEQII